MTDVAQFEARIKSVFDSRGAKDAIAAFKRIDAAADKAAAKVEALASRGVRSRIKPFQFNPRTSSAPIRGLSGPRASSGIFTSNSRKTLSNPNVADFQKKGAIASLAETFKGTSLGSALSTLQGLGTQVGIVGAGLAAMATTAHLVGSALSAAFSFAEFSVVNVTRAIYGMTEALVSATYEAITFGQRSRLAFGALVDDAALGEETFDNVRQLAQKLGLDVKETSDGFIKLLAAQFSIGQSTELIKATADLRALGASADNVKLALLAISQIKMKGKLQAEELTRQLANAGVSAELVYKELMKPLGKNTIGEVMKMQKAGQISADVAIPAIISAINKKMHQANPGDTALKFATQKFDGMMGVLKATKDNFFIDIARAMDSSFMGAAGDIFNSLTDIINGPKFAEFKKSMTGVFESVIAFVKSAWPSIVPSIEGTLNLLIEAFDNISNYINNNGESIKEKISGISKVALLFGNIMFDTAMAVYDLVDSVVQLIVALEKLANNKVFKVLFQSLSGAVGGASGAMAGALLPGVGPLSAIGGAVGGSAGSSAGAGIMNYLGKVGGMMGAGPQMTSRDALNASADARYTEGPLSGLLAGVNNQRVGLGGANGAVWKNTTVGDVNINVNALDVENNEELAQMIGTTARREIHKVHEDGG